MKKESKLYRKISANKLAENPNFHAMIHDIKSPLNQVEGLIRIALNQNQDEEVEKLLKMALESNSRLSSMVSDILVSASCETNDRINLKDMMNRLCNRLKGMDGFEETIITLHQDDPVRFFTNRALLASILQNLLENAIKYRKPGNTANKIEVNCSFREGNACIEVKDNGIGIDPELLPKIFQRSVRNGTNCGHGMGLFISRENAERLGGTLTASSIANMGSTFMLILPVKLSY